MVPNRYPPPEGHAFYGGPFSNFALSPIRVGGKWYETVEHAFQASKATSKSEHERIRTARGPMKAKHLGNATDLRPDWEEVKYDVMVECLREKYKISHFRQALLATGDQFIYEDSPTDDIWGLRDKQGGWTGQNLLGTALMQVREEIRAGT